MNILFNYNFANIFIFIFTVKFHTVLPWQEQHSTREDSLHQQIGLRSKEEISEVLHLEQNFVWCGNLHSSETRSQVPGMF
jgi:hypothetical protein